MSEKGAPGARPAKVPMKVNAFDVIRTANAQLMPLFPYMGPGDIVPCCAGFESDGSGTHIGYFLHQNTVDEVAIVLGANGQMRTGDVFVGPKLHGVGGDSDKPYFAAMTITQRQLEEGEQKEALTFQCEKCNTHIHHFEFNESIGGEGRFAGLPTIMGSEDWAISFNSNEELRKCTSCGHVNRPFPLYIWGWANYTRNTRIVQKAAKALEEVAG